MQAQVAPYVGITVLRGRVVVCDLARLVVGNKELVGLSALLCLSPGGIRSEEVVLVRGEGRMSNTT